MNKIALLGSAFVLASAMAVSASTTTIFDDHFVDSSFDPDGNVLNWGGVAGKRDTCSTTELTCLAMDANTGIESNYINVLAGAVYNLSILFSGSSSDVVAQVSFGGTYDALHTITPGIEYTFNNPTEFIFDTDTNARFTIYAIALEDGDPQAMAYLNRVTLTETIADDPPTVPVPASAPLLLAGLGAVGALRLRKKS